MAQKFSRFFAVLGKGVAASDTLGCMSCSDFALLGSPSGDFP
jgi:hypothetical protein